MAWLPAPVTNSTSAASPYRWTVALLLGLGVLVNYFDRVNLSVSHDALVRDFGISALTFGLLSGAYNWTYALCQLPIGVMLDRIGIRRVGRISAGLWSIASFTGALAPNLAALFGARLLLGVGEAPTFPANAKAIGLWFPAEQRGLPTAIFDAAAKLASAIGVPLLGLFLLRAGWRWSFALTGLISLAFLALFYLFYRDPDEEEGRSAAGAPLPLQRAAEANLSLGQLLRQPKVLGLALGFGSYNYVFYLLLTWLPTYLSSALGIDLLHSFLYTGVPWLVATATDLLVGGWLVDALIARGFSAHRVRKSILIAGTACGLGILGAANAHTPARALLWISLSIGGLAAAAPVGWSLPSLIAPRSSVGAVGGIVNFSNQISGIAAPVVTGYLVGVHHNYQLAFGVAAAYLLLGIAGYVFLLGRIEPIAL